MKFIGLRSIFQSYVKTINYNYFNAQEKHTKRRYKVVQNHSTCIIASYAEVKQHFVSNWYA